MPDATRSSPAEPDYGFDAPGVTATMLGSGAAAVVIGLGIGRWLGSKSARAAGGALALVGAAPLILGSTVLYYSLAGKHRTREAMLNFVQWRGDEQVLDVGAGSGLLMIGAAKRLTRAGLAVGVDTWSARDLSDNAVETTRRNIALEGVGDRTQIVTGDATRLRFPDAAFDVVLSLLCLHNLEPRANRDRACREIARVLKPGGRVVIGDYVPTDAYAAVLRECGLVVARCKPAFGVARSLMWILVADKPAGAKAPV